MKLHNIGLIFMLRNGKCLMKNKKKQLLALLLALCASASLGCATVASAAEAANETTTSSTDTTTSTPTDSTTSDGATSDAPDSSDSSETPSEPAEPLKPGWNTRNGSRYYADSEGNPVTGWKTIDGKKYYFDEDGVMETMWRTIDGKKYYFGNSGEMRTGWRTINGKKYYFGNSGEMRTMWRTIDGKRYYFGNSGEMRTGWRTIDGKKYYFQNSGAQLRKKGFQTINQKTYYFTGSYTVQQNWKTINNKTYYFGKSGEMRTGWRTINNKIYHFDTNGAMESSVWTRRGSNRYYLQSNGAAATGWKKLGKYRYYFSSKGVLSEDVRNRSDITGPYELVVSLKECTVTVLATGKDGVTNIAAAKFICSPGKASTPTPTGVYYSNKTTKWQELMGPSWGQYGVHVYAGIFFHSIPCAQANEYNVPEYDYYTLGSPASHGCIRLLVRDEKWVYNHAGGNGIKTTITNTDSQSTISYLSKPKIPDLQYGNGMTWDPTDPVASKKMGTPLAKVTYEIPSYENKSTSNNNNNNASNETLVKYQATDDIKYRAAPGYAGTVKGTLYDGETVYVVKGANRSANGMEWFKIKKDGKYYYVAGQYLTKI